MGDRYNLLKGFEDCPSILYSLVDEFVKAHPDISFRDDYGDVFADWVKGMDGENEKVG